LLCSILAVFGLLFSAAFITEVPSVVSWSIDFLWTILSPLTLRMTFVRTFVITNPWQSLPALERHTLDMPLIGCFVSEDEGSTSVPKSIATVDKSACWNAVELSERGSLVIDTGASQHISHCRSDFLTYEPLTDRVVKGLEKSSRIVGRGIVEWHIPAADGELRFFRVTAYHVPSAQQRLFSPQTYIQDIRKVEKGNQERGDHDHKMYQLYGHATLAPIQAPFAQHNNLPMTIVFTSKALAQAYEGLTSCITAAQNQNLTPSQKCLLRWHFRLGHISFNAVQAILKTGLLAHSESQKTLHRAASRCEKPKCACCEFGKARRRKAQGKTTTPDSSRTGALSKEVLLPGQKVSIDHYVSSVRGRLYTSFGKSPPHQMFSGGTIMVDHASDFVAVHHQVGTSASETIKGLTKFEATMKDFGVTVQSYHSDTGSAFTSGTFAQHLLEQEQTQTLAGKGAHHHSGKVERTIGVIMGMARTMMFHAAVHWPEVADAELWPMAVDHAVYLYNRIPNPSSGLSPLEILSNQKISVAKYNDFHVWGCPTYVLDPRLADGKKIPKFEPRSNRAVFMGFSPMHSSSSPLTLDLNSGAIRPHYHCIFDDWFATVSSQTDNTKPVDFDSEPWSELLMHNRYFYPLDDDDPLLDTPFVPDPAYEKAVAKRDQMLSRDALHPYGLNGPDGSQVPQPFTKERVDNKISFDSSLELSVNPTPPQPSEPPTVRSPPPSPPPLPKPTPPATPPKPTPTPVPTPRSTTPLVSRRSPPKPKTEASPQPIIRRSARSNFGQKPARYQDTIGFAQLEVCMLESLFDEVDAGHSLFEPILLEALAAKNNNPDILNYEEAMSAPDAFKFKESMDTEIDGLEKHGTWEIVDRSEATSKILPGIWTFRRKRFPSGELRKTKGRWACRGDLEEDKGETYAPVVQTSTVRLMFYFTMFFGFKTKCIDFEQAFVQSKLERPVFMSFPRGMRHRFPDDSKCLRLKKSIYGLARAPRLYYLFMKEHFTAMGLKQSKCDPCLWYGNGMMLVQYVDDVIGSFKDDKTMNSFFKKLKARQLAFTHEGDLANYLGIALKRDMDKRTITMTQTGLIDKILQATNMEDCNPHPVPAGTLPLVSDKYGARANEEWDYRSVVGMLLYLSMHSRPDIAFAVSQVCRFSHDPRASHCKAVKQLVRYLKGTRDKGLILKSNKTLTLDAFVDADFSGLYAHEDKTDPVSVKSRTGFVVTIGGCPLLWQSKLQQLHALSTTESEINAATELMRSLIPLRLIVREMSEHLGLKAVQAVSTKTTVWEDNAGAVVIANSPQVTPRSKHYAHRYFWWKHHAESPDISVEKISTKEQQADIFTKGLAKDQFVYLRQKIMGW